MCDKSLLKIVVNIFMFIVAVLPLMSKDTTKFGAFVLDSLDGKPMIGANVKLTGLIDTTAFGAVSNKRGYFHFDKIKNGKYTVNISYVGYKQFTKDIEINDSVNTYKFYMLPSFSLTSEVLVRAKSLMGENRGDTLAYNAGYFRTGNDETAEDLLKKLPGVEVGDDGIKVHNQTITQILVNGKPFPIVNPNDIYKLFPANQIKKIELYNKQSKQAEFQGIKKNNDINTINIVTESKKLYFGNVDAAATDDSKFALGAFGSSIRDDATYTLSARWGTGASDYDYIHNKKNDNKEINLGSRFEFNNEQFIDISYNYEKNYQETKNYSARNYFDSDTFKLYDSESGAKSSNYAHTVSFDSDFKLDSLNAMSIRGKIRYINSDNSSLTFNRYKDVNFRESSKSTTGNNGNGEIVNFSTDVLFMHKFINPLRRLSLDLSIDNNNSQNSSQQNFDNDYFITNHNNDSSIKKNRINSPDFNTDFDLRYTEPIVKNLSMNLNFQGNYKRYKTNKNASILNVADDVFDIDSTLSKKENDDSYSQRLGAELEYKNENLLDVSLKTEYEYKYDKYDIDFPTDNTFETDYRYFNPTFSIMYSLSKSSKLNFYYHSDRDFPSYQQIQKIVDNTNPLYISSGNPDLKPSTSHLMNLDYSMFNMEKLLNIYLVCSFEIKENSILNSTYFAKNDTTILGNILLPAGAQYTAPVNRNGYKCFMTYAGVGKGNSEFRFGIGGQFMYSENPTIYNGLDYLSKTLLFTTNVNVYGNIAKKLEIGGNVYMTSSQSKYVYTDYKSVTARTSLSCKYELVNNLKFEVKLHTTNYLKQSTVNNKNSNILNLSVSYAFFNKKLETKFTAFDILNQYVRNNKSVSTFYTEENYSETSKQLFGISLKYKFNDTNSSGTREISIENYD